MKLETLAKAAVAMGIKSLELLGPKDWPLLKKYGFKENFSDEEGIKNTVAGIKKVIGLAEKKTVNICIEILNS